jgi:hypothetical protein
MTATSGEKMKVRPLRNGQVTVRRTFKVDGFLPVHLRLSIFAHFWTIRPPLCRRENGKLHVTAATLFKRQQSDDAIKRLTIRVPWTIEQPIN